MPGIAAAEDKALVPRLAHYLRSQGFEVMEQAKLKGRSGLEHSFDFLARRDDGFAQRTIAFAVLTSVTDQSAAEAAIFTFANKTYDVAISERAVILPAAVARLVQGFADSQKVQLFDEASLKIIFNQEEPSPVVPPALDRPLKFADRTDLIDSLRKTGYRVEEGARLTGVKAASSTPSTWWPARLAMAPRSTA